MHFVCNLSVFLCARPTTRVQLPNSVSSRISAAGHRSSVCDPKLDFSSGGGGGGGQTRVHSKFVVHIAKMAQIYQITHMRIEWDRKCNNNVTNKLLVNYYATVNGGRLFNFTG